MGCVQNHCYYSQSYTEGSSLNGYFFHDMVRLGDTIQRNPPVLTTMGCNENENKLFYTQKANGILGIAVNSPILHQLFSDRKHVQSKIFSICFAEWGGRFVVGGHNSTYHTGPLHYVQLDIAMGRYGVPLSAMSVGGVAVSNRFGSTIVDSGTTYTYMGTEPYRALRSAIEQHCQLHGCGGAELVGKCWDLPNADALLKFPNVTCNFGNVRTIWAPRAYLFRKAVYRMWCYAFEDDGPDANTVLGASWMVHSNIVFDMVQKRLGVASSNCPEFKQRPEHKQDANLDPPRVTPITPPSPPNKSMALLQGASKLTLEKPSDLVGTYIIVDADNSTTTSEHFLGSLSSVLQTYAVHLVVSALSLALMCSCYIRRQLRRQQPHKYIEPELLAGTELGTL